MEDSEYESTESALSESSKKRTFPLPTSKGVFIFVGAAMIITVLGVAGYIFYKGPDSKSQRLVARSDSGATAGPRGHEEEAVDDAVSAPPTPKNPKPVTSKRPKKKRSAPASPGKKKSKPTKKAGRKRRSTTENVMQDAPQDAPQNAPQDSPQNSPEEPEGGETDADVEQASDDDITTIQESSDHDDSEEEDNKNARRLFKEDPHCTSVQELHQCSKEEQPDMMRSYVCLSNSQGSSCIEWRPQRLCLSAEGNRFGSEKQCREACQGDNASKCGKAALCECTKLYRKMNYVFDVRRQRCRLVALHECVEEGVGFPDEDSCNTACSNDDKDTRCKLAALEDLVRPCLWNDKLYTHFYDHKSGRCKGWDEDVCATDAFSRITLCLNGCKETGSSVKQAQQLLQGNATLGE